MQESQLSLWVNYKYFSVKEWVNIPLNYCAGLINSLWKWLIEAIVVYSSYGSHTFSNYDNLMLFFSLKATFITVIKGKM